MNNTEAARIITSATRVKTLEAISGLIVIASVRGKGHHHARFFQFMHGDKTVKTVCTYNKAKVFAEGVAIGKTLQEETNE